MENSKNFTFNKHLNEDLSVMDWFQWHTECIKNGMSFQMFWQIR